MNPKVEQIQVILDMETQDPDDVFTLMWLAYHPRVRLKAVTLTPGSKEQVELVWSILADFDYPRIPVGVRRFKNEKTHVNPWLYRVLKAPGIRDEAYQDALKYSSIAHQVIADNLTKDTVLVTCGPPANLGYFLENHPSKEVPFWLAQGGFAGDNLVAPEDRLDKFNGMVTCPTFNFNGAPKAAKAGLASDMIKKRRLVSKNVCHGVIYDRKVLNENINQGVKWINDAMREYLRKKPEGKMFHDLLAVATLIDPSICEYAEVEVYREKGLWGSRPKEGSNTWITTKVDKERFWDVFFLRKGNVV